MGDSLLKLDDIGYAYSSDGDWRLERVSLKLHAGKLVGLIGPNGAGKSTILKIAAGILQPAKGTVRLIGRPLNRLSRRDIAKKIGYLPQNVPNTFDWRLEEVVAMGRFAHLKGAGFLSNDDRAIVQKCMEATETAQYRGRLMSHLSGGERQRGLLASVLAQEPKILLLDEPACGLDLHHQAAFFDLLGDLADSGMAVAVVTHDLNLASLYCGRVVLLSAGKIVRDGGPSDVIRQDTLSEIYRGGLEVLSHPTEDRPIVLPARETRR